MKLKYDSGKPVLFFSGMIVAVVFMLTACNPDFLCGTKTVFVRFPPIPPQVPEYARITGWRVVCPDASGKLTSEIKNITETGISLIFKKNLLTPVLVYPLCGKTQFYKPAGALYPLNAQPEYGQELQASWESGFAAHFVMNVLIKADQPFEQARQAAAFINWRRFDEESRKCKNPWTLNETKLYQAIESGELTTRSFSRSAENRVRTVLPERFLTIIPEYIRDEPIAVPTQGTHTELTLVPGVNRFMTIDSVLSVFHDKKGSNTLVISETPR